MSTTDHDPASVIPDEKRICNNSNLYRTFSFCRWISTVTIFLWVKNFHLCLEHFRVQWSELWSDEGITPKRDMTKKTMHRTESLLRKVHDGERWRSELGSIVSLSETSQMWNAVLGVWTWSWGNLKMQARRQDRPRSFLIKAPIIERWLRQDVVAKNAPGDSEVNIVRHTSPTDAVDAMLRMPCVSMLWIIFPLACSTSRLELRYWKGQLGDLYDWIPGS